MRGIRVALSDFRQFQIGDQRFLFSDAKRFSMVSRERVEAVLDRIRPLMQADGGDIELVSVTGNNAHVRLTGMCSGCPSAHMTLYMGVEMALREEIKEFEQLQVV
jgi:Fe-S cluster biogenesis protein NfuA